MLISMRQFARMAGINRYRLEVIYDMRLVEGLPDRFKGDWRGYKVFDDLAQEFLAKNDLKTVRTTFYKKRNPKPKKSKYTPSMLFLASMVDRTYQPKPHEPVTPYRETLEELHTEYNSVVNTVDGFSTYSGEFKAPPTQTFNYS